MSASENCSDRCTSFGRFVFNHDRRELLRDHHRLELPAASIELLGGLLDKAGQTVRHAQLTRAALGGGTAATESTRTAMRQLRQALRDPADYPMYIETVRGVGYRFIAPVQQPSALQAAPTPSVLDASALVSATDPIAPNRPDRPSSSQESAPERNLLQWIADDASSVDFAVVWSIALVPFTLCFVRVDIAALMLVPPVVRMAQRAAVFRRLLLDGVAPEALQRAIGWANDGEASAPKPAGWRLLLARGRRVTGWAFIAATVISFLAAEYKPWTWSRPLQGAFDVFVTGYFRLGQFGVGVFLLDAVARPRPVWQGVRRWSRRSWRQLLTRLIPATPSANDRYRIAADHEVELLLGVPTD